MRSKKRSNKLTSDAMSRTPPISRTECIERIGAPMSTVRRPILDTRGPTARGGEGQQVLCQVSGRVLRRAQWRGHGSGMPRRRTGRPAGAVVAHDELAQRHSRLCRDAPQREDRVGRRRVTLLDVGLDGDARVDEGAARGEGRRGFAGASVGALWTTGWGQRRGRLEQDGTRAAPVVLLVLVDETRVNRVRNVGAANMAQRRVSSCVRPAVTEARTRRTTARTTWRGSAGTPLPRSRCRP